MGGLGGEWPVLEDPVRVEVVDDRPVGADGDPRQARLGGDHARAAGGAGGREDDLHAGAAGRLECGARPRGDRSVGVEERAVEVDRDEPGTSHGDA